MLFGLKNTCSTYQPPMNKIFKDLIRWNMEVYVNNMLVKSKEAKTHSNNLRKAFATLWRYQMKPNIAKHDFGVALRNFLDFMIPI